MSTPQGFHVRVPGLEAEEYTDLQLGHLESGFIGVRAVAANGPVYLGASSPNLFTKTSFEDCVKTAAIITESISAIQATVGIGQARLSNGYESKFALATDIYELGTSVYKLVKLSTEGQEAPERGTATLFGSSAVNLVSIGGVSCSAACTATVNGGLSATLTGTKADVRGFLSASLKSGATASVRGMKSEIIGATSVMVAAKDGQVTVRGALIEIGNKEIVPEFSTVGVVPYLFGGNKATTHVRVMAKSEIALGSGGATGAQLRVMSGEIQAHTPDASLALTKRASLVSGRSAMLVGSSGIQLVRTAADPHAVAQSAIAAAQELHDQSVWAASWEHEEVNEKLWVSDTLAVGLAGTAFVAGLEANSPLRVATRSEAGIVKENEELSKDAKLGLGTVGAVATAFLAKVGVGLVVRAVAAKALEKIKRGARKTLDEAVTKALEARDTALKAEASNPLDPKIEIKDGTIELSVGTNKITVSQAGIELKSDAPIELSSTAWVEVNGHPFTK